MTTDGAPTADAPLASLTVESTNGCQIALHYLGGSGPDLIICHATGFHGRVYGPLAASLVGDFTVWGIDMRGHGASTAPDNGDYAWRGMAEDLLACVDALEADSVAAVGHSLGGAAILLAELRRPGTVRSAYLYEPIVLPPGFLAGRSENPMSGPARNRREVFPSKEAAFWRYASRPPLNGLRADALVAYVDGGFVDLDDGTVRLACRAESEARTFECEEKMTIERLDGLSIPLTVGAGLVAGDPNPADFAPLIVAAVPDAKLIEYDHLGHFGPLEAPGIVGADVLEALS